MGRAHRILVLAVVRGVGVGYFRPQCRDAAPVEGDRRLELQDGETPFTLTAVACLTTIGESG